MFIFVLQIRHAVENAGELYLFALFSAIVWALWVIKVALSSRYRPWTEPHDTTTSVIIPVVDEPLDLFRDVLARIVAQRPTEVIVVINGARNEALEEVCEEFSPEVRWVHVTTPGKRNAVKVGTELARGDIAVLVDSDTIWTEGTLPELVKPFADPAVGGVTTRQRILEPERSWITRWADWLENTRSLYSMPAQSVLGQIGCLPGRTIAFRRDIVLRVMEPFMTARFLGVFLEVSDDRTLTNLTLKAGYKTVYQHTSLVYTDAPLEVRKLFKQQLRWARGSQYNTLRMLPWMLGHAPVLAVFFVADILLPFILLGVVIGWAYRAATNTGVNFYDAILSTYGMDVGLPAIIALAVLSSVLSMGIRQVRHLQEKPSDFFRLPVFILASTAFLMPVRLIGFFRLAHVAGWGTRAGAYVAGGEDVGMGSAGAVRSDAPPVPRPREPGMVLQPVAAGTALLPGAPATVLEPRPAGTVPVTPAPVRTRRSRRRPNPKAAIPYLIGLSIIALEVSQIVR